MILNSASVVIFLFIAFNLFYHCRCPLWLKIAGTAALFLISMKFQIYELLGGAFFAPKLPRDVIIVLEALYGSLFILFFLLLLWDLYLLGNWLLSKAGFPIPQSLPRGLIKGGLCVLALILGGWGAWQAVKVPSVRDIELKISDLAPGLEGFTFVQLSDLHIGPLLKKNWLEEVVKKTNALDPDIIALTGDYVDGRAEEIGQELEPLAGLRARRGVFGVTGNHEYYWNAAEWTEAIRNLGVSVLNNEHAFVDAEGSGLVIAGIPDLAASRFGFPPPDLSKAFAGAPEGLRLLLSHQPKIFKEAASAADIQISGHTHGGLMFFLQPLVAAFNAGFVSGLYSEGAGRLYVNPGTGLWNGFSCRLGAPSEITRFILRRA